MFLHSRSVNPRRSRIHAWQDWGDDHGPHAIAARVSRRGLMPVAIFWFTALGVTVLAVVLYLAVSVVRQKRRRRTSTDPDSVSWLRWPPWPWRAADQYRRTEGEDAIAPHDGPNRAPTSSSGSQLSSTLAPAPVSSRAPNCDSHQSSLRHFRSRSQSQPQSQPDAVSAQPQSQSAVTSGAGVGRSTTTSATADETPDRHTSVRSVMTLPPYRPLASDAEEVLGREGERDGIDIVVERPTEEEEEALREEEMSALYDIRTFRRQQLADRTERQRQRREARERNDAVALERLRSRPRDESNGQLDALRRQHERVREQRKCSGSSVSYADVGLVRNNGTRIRPGPGPESSTRSTTTTPSIITPSSSSSIIDRPPGSIAANDEGVGLLSDMASFSAASTLHRRDYSSGSVLSIDGDGHSALPSPRYSRSRTSSAGSTIQLQVIATPTSHQFNMSPRAGSSPEILETDLTDWEIAQPPTPHTPPPEYDELSLTSEPAVSLLPIPRLPSLRLNELPHLDLEPMPPPQSHRQR